ncbi:isochorismatase family protein [Streptomyces nodosus]|uniref:Cysteine hydrolase n=1 Tax=Streptomyces nodosus TaxID=40318 RepID=A0A5P2VYH2_9ACTN|nr:isochorismatase family cysteine hydrolase [Streptomyces nodosus]MBB4790125.1 ureidoacrylate peracid hydrolase [Streptomyces nodosus]QEV37822.1 cysteine hydrolase [Streptomyces nodosus]
MNAKWRVNPQNAALLVIDMQNDFVLEGYPMEVPMARRRLPAMQEVIAECRASEIPVVYTRHILLDAFDVSPLESAYNPALLSAGLRKGTSGSQVVDDLRPEPDDVVIQKHRYDAFHNTQLENVLTSISGLRQVDTVIVIGTLTEVCCDSTARGAYMRDFKVAFVSDATGARSDEAQRATENTIGTFFGRVLTTRELVAEIHEGREGRAA